MCLYSLHRKLCGNFKHKIFFFAKLIKISRIVRDKPKHLSRTRRINLKIARYEAHGQIHYGAIEGDEVKELTASPFDDFSVSDHTHASLVKF